MGSFTDEQVAELTRRQREASYMQQASPPMLPLAGWEKELADAQAEALERRRAAASAEEERLQAERDGEAERQRREWEANAPKRERAKRELNQVEEELAKVNAQRDELLARSRELHETASR
jgi:hypothetical protein